MATSVAASAVTYANQSEAANNQADYQNKMYGRTASAAMSNFVQKNDSVNRRLQQEEAVASEQSEALGSQVNQARSAVTVSAAERGVAGPSVQELLNNFSMVESRNNLNRYTNLRWQADQANEEQKSFQATGQSQIVSATPRPIQGPSALGLGLDIGASLYKGIDLSMYNSGSGYYNPKNPNSLKAPISSYL